MSRQTSYTIVDLLPYKSDVLLTKPFLIERLVKLTIYLLNEISKTIDDITYSQNTTNYDPHVGENLCQIRAVHLLEILSYDKSYLIDTLQITKNHLSECIKALSSIQPEKLVTNQTLLSLLKSFNVIFPIQKELYTLILMRFLTNFRICNSFDNMVINYNKMLDDLGISKNLSRRFIHHYQKELSYLSCEFILKISNHLGSKFTSILQLVSHKDEDARTTLPSYLVMKVLLPYLKMHKTNILFVVKNTKSQKFTTLFYQYDKQHREYQLITNPTVRMKRSHCFVLHGITCHSYQNKNEFIKQFEAIGLINVIMGNMATHPQYSGKKLLGIKQNPFVPLNTCSNRTITRYASELEEEFLQAKRLGEQVGCTEKNPTLFFIRHIFIDTLNQQLKHVNFNKFYSDQVHEQIRQVA